MSRGVSPTPGVIRYAARAMLAVGRAGWACCPRVACAVLASGNVVAGRGRGAGAMCLAAGSARGRGPRGGGVRGWLALKM